MIKILHLQPELNLACGVTRTISQIIENTSQEFEHHLIALDGDGLSRFTEFGFHPKLLKHKRNSVIGTIRIFLTLAKYCKYNSIQIIHSHHRYFDTLSWLLKLLFPIKTVTSVQSKVFGKSFFSYKADVLIPCSKAISDHISKNFNVKKSKIQLIYNSTEPVNSNKLKDKKELLTELNIPNSSTIIGFVGRINFEEKGLDILLEAFQQLNRDYSNLFLILVGNGKNEIDVAEYINENKLSGLLIPPQKNILEYLNILDIFVLPSRIDPFPLIMIECGILKKPVIASNVDGIPELIKHLDTGLLFEKGNVNDLRKQIITLLVNVPLRNTIANNLFKKVNRDFLVDKMVRSYEQVYYNLVK